MLNSKLYDVLKWVNQVLMPAAATLMASLGYLWGLDENLIIRIVGSITALGVFLGLLLGISYVQYNKSKEEK